MRTIRTPNQEEAGVLIGMLAIIFGGFVRLYPEMISGFPINDGGLFVVMINSLKANSFKLPAYFQYNNLNIPFAYPPFAFYIGAFLSTIFHINSIDIVRWIPGIILVCTVPAFYYLSRAVLNTAYETGLATMAFAFTPRSFTWGVMGGGLTRSFGLLFLLLSLGSIYRLIRNHQRKYLLSSILFCGLVVLSHPEAAIHTIALAIFFLILIGRNKQGISDGLLIGIGTVIITCIWWLPTLLQIGSGPFLAAAQTGSQSSLSILFPFVLTLTDEPFLTFIAILGLIGFFICIVNKKYLLPIWYFIPYLIDPRSGATYAMIPLSIMAGLALSDIILPAIAKLGNLKEAGQNNPFHSRIAVTFLLTSALFMLGGTIAFGNQIAGSTLSEPDRKAMAWIKENTSNGSRFLVMTGESQVFCDSIQEWFPVLTKQIGITTIQGNEWLPDHKYVKSVMLQTTVQSCMDGLNPLSCIEKYHLDFQYIYINSKGSLKNFCRVIAPITRGVDLIAALKNENGYLLTYQSQPITIFSKLP